MNRSQLREALANEAETGNVLGLIGCRQRRRLEALLGKIVAAVQVNQLVGIRLDVIENFAQKLVGKSQEAACGILVLRGHSSG